MLLSLLGGIALLLTACGVGAGLNNIHVSPGRSVSYNSSSPYMRKLLLAVLSVCPAFAGEYAVLRNDMRLYAESHERTGDIIRLKTETGAVELPASEIVRFETEEVERSKPAPPALRAAEQAAALTAPAKKTPQELVEDAAKQHGLRPEFVKSIASAESA